MKRGEPISNALHLLVHMANAGGKPLTSEELAECLHTNPVVIRRGLADLRRAELVHSARGHGGGWILARPTGEITLQEVYAALGIHLLAPPRTESPGCGLEASVNRALTQIYQDIEVVLVDRLQKITLADLHRDTFSGSGAHHAPHQVEDHLHGL